MGMFNADSSLSLSVFLSPPPLSLLHFFFLRVCRVISGDAIRGVFLYLWSRHQ